MPNKGQKSKELTSKVLYIASTAFIAIGLFCAFAGWYEEQTMEAVWGSMIIQAVGIAGYFIGKILSTEKAPFFVDWFNIVGIAFIPCSIITGYISILVFNQGWIASYPIDTIHTLIFSVVLFVVLVMSFIFIKKQKQSTQ